MRDLFAAAWDLQGFCVSQGWKSCFIGGLAILRWGATRLTQDVDMTLLTGFRGEELFVDALLKRYQSRVANGRESFLIQRVMLLQDAAGVPLDIALGGLPFEESAVARATPFEFIPGEPLQICSAEDLIVMKAFAARGRDWTDVESVITYQGTRLDWKYIYAQLIPLANLKEAPELVEQLRGLEKEWRKG